MKRSQRRTGADGQRRKRRPPLGAAVIAGAVLAGLVATGAMADRGDALREAVRNGTTQGETEIIGDIEESTGEKGGYVTRQSNVATGDDAGGAAIYGCRAPTASTETCLRAANLSSGLALSLATAGSVAADIQVGNPAGVPFTTNATGVVANLNADKVDGLDAEQLRGAAGSDAVSGVGLSDLANATIISNTGFTAIPALTQTVTVPAGEQRRLLASFSAETACYGAAGYCGIRILVDGNELAPAVGLDFAFDSSDNNTETSSSWESHNVQRYSGNLAAGNHTVTVEARTTVNTLNFRIDDAVLSTTLAAAG